MPMIAHLEPDPSLLAVVWNDSVRTEYPWLWLRDHAHDDETMHPITQQRQLYTAGVGIGLSGMAVVTEDGGLEISWPDGSTPSRLPLVFLLHFRRPTTRRAAIEIEPIPWDWTTHGGEAPSVSYKSVMTSDEGVIDWLTTVARYGFCIAQGTPHTLEATEELIDRLGYVRHTIFGGFWDFEADLSKADTAYTNLELRPHTDGTYSHDAPGMQVLHCISFDGTGGESSIVDGFLIADKLKASSPEHYETLSTVAVPGQYIGDGSHLMAARPVFRHDHTGTLCQVSFNNSDRAPFLLPADEMTAFYDAARAFETLANDHRLQWRHVLRPGEALLFDNWRVLHGRAAYSGRRHLCGAYLNHEDFESKLRLAGPAH